MENKQTNTIKVNHLEGYKVEASPVMQEMAASMNGSFIFAKC